MSTKVTKKMVFSAVKEAKEVTKAMLSTLSMTALDELENLIYDELEENTYTDNLITLIAETTAEKRAEEATKAVANKKAPVPKQTASTPTAEQESALTAEQENKISEILEAQKQYMKEAEKKTAPTAPKGKKGKNSKATPTPTAPETKTTPVEKTAEQLKEEAKKKAEQEKAKAKEAKAKSLEKALEAFRAVKEGDQYIISVKNNPDYEEAICTVKLVDEYSIILADTDNFKYEITFERFFKKEWTKYIDNKKETLILSKAV